MLLSEFVEVKIHRNNAKYYKDLGYEIPMRKASERYCKEKGKEYVPDEGKTIIVRVEDLQDGCNVDLLCKCDYCGEPYKVKNRQYNHTPKLVDKDACKKCSMKKQQEVISVKYGVKSCFELEFVKEKKMETNIRKYGVPVVAQCPDVAMKIKKSLNETYSDDSKREEIISRRDETNLQKYGVKNPMQLKEILEKRDNTVCEKYGVSNVLQSPVIREKIANTLYDSCLNNHLVKASKQQKYIFYLYQSHNASTFLNYPIKYYNADICILNDRLAVEYDGSFHDGSVKMGDMTQEEFDHRETKRFYVIKSEGYNQMRIISRKDRLPSAQILLQMLNFARNYFQTTTHSWVCYDIDKSLLFNAENKNGIPYNYGSLRTIKDSDLDTIKTNN